MLGLISEGKVVFATDGCGCYNVNTGKCFCAECYYYGPEAVNCSDAKLSKKDGLVPIKWDTTTKRFITV